MSAAPLYALLLVAELWLDGGALDAGPPAPAAAPVPAPAAEAPSVVAAKEWNRLRKPAPGPPQSIGSCNAGCLQGAAALPPSGPGYEVARLGRNRRYGHPLLVAFVKRLGAGAKRAKLGLVVAGDLSQPRGGPTPTGHRSHQTGLDADIGYAAPAGLRPGHVSAQQREDLSPVAVIDLKTRKPTPAWGPKIIELIALAAADPTVDRIFVHPTVKKMLCEAPRTAKAAWQGRIRPWWAHHDHFHVRLRCPQDSPLCVPQETPPDNGCGPTLAWWFSEDSEARRAKKKEAETAAAAAAAAKGQERVRLPEACERVRAEADAK